MKNYLQAPTSQRLFSAEYHVCDMFSNTRMNCMHFFSAALARGIFSLLARVQSLKRKENLRCYSSVAHQHFYEFLQGMDVTM